jgi:hypothetical protein
MSDKKFPNIPPVFFCEKCDVTCSKTNDWNRHILTAKHKKHDISDEKVSKVSAFSACEPCGYKCNKESLWNKHILTAKHLKNVSGVEVVGHSCDICNRMYKCYSSLWSHKKKCVKSDPTTIIDKILAENQELRAFMVEQSKEYSRVLLEQRKETSEIMNKVLELSKPGNMTINNTNNSNNKSFNINLFLNEQCKDAFNFTEFVNNIKISYQDLENNAQLGFVQGISKIFMDNLKQLDISERPIHCTDVKRETMYIKDEDKWNKEVDDSKLQKAIQTVSYKSMGKLMEWKQENPDYQDADSEFSKRCLDIQRQSLAGSDREVYYPKVIHALAKETMVDK